MSNGAKVALRAIVNNQFFCICLYETLIYRYNYQQPFTTFHFCSHTPNEKKTQKNDCLREIGVCRCNV